jgi:multiple sugar transport system permease protein
MICSKPHALMQEVPGMSGTQQVLEAPRPVAARRRRPAGPRRLPGSDLVWTVAFLAPYAAVFLAFVLYPVAYGLWMGSSPSLYAELAADPLYVRTLINTALFVGIGVNLKLFLALLLSGFFMRRRRWIKVVLVIFILPWALPAIPAFLSFHWMLIGEQGLLDSLLSALFGIEGPIWFNHRWLALGSNIVAYIWKWLPFWTVILLAGRMAIPQELNEAAAIDGATGTRRFVHVTVPLLANLYLVCTLLSTIWTIGDFTTVARSTEVLAIIGVRYAFDVARPPLGVAAALSALPVLIPLAIALMRRLQTRGVQL